MVLTIRELWPCTATRPQQGVCHLERDMALTQSLCTCQEGKVSSSGPRTDEVLTVRGGLPRCCGDTEAKNDAENYSYSFALAYMHSCGYS